MKVPASTPSTPRASVTRSAPPPYQLVDAFDSVSEWRSYTSDGVEANIRADSGAHGRAMRVDFDFHGHGGYAVVHRDLELDLPVNYSFSFAVRGHAPRNTLEFKLVDSSHTNTWWSNTPEFDFPEAWRTISRTRREICYAWGRGPVMGPDIHHAAAIEFAITAGTGGRGSVWFDDLAITPLDPETPFAVTTPAGSPPIVGTWISETGPPNGLRALLRFAGDGTVLSSTIMPMGDVAYEVAGERLTLTRRDAGNGRSEIQTMTVRIDGDSLFEKDGYGPGRDLIMRRVASSTRGADPIVGLWTFPRDAALTTFVAFSANGRMLARTPVNACAGTWSESPNGRLTLTFNRVSPTMDHVVAGDVLTLKGSSGEERRYLRETPFP